MTPGAHIAASIELLETTEDAWQQGKKLPADAAIGSYFKNRRYIGSKDRAAIARMVYSVLRKGSSLQWWAEQHHLPITPRALVITALMVEEHVTMNGLLARFTGQGYDPHPLTAAEEEAAEALVGSSSYHPDMPEWMQLNTPEWCIPLIKETFGDDYRLEVMALGTEAPLDLRVNTLKTNREEAKERLRGEGFIAEETPYSPLGLRLHKRGAIFATKTFQEGWIEVQDEGSQLVAMLADAQPGQKVIDFCAGAGGKTLALAAQMKNKGRILAWDVSETRLEQSHKRFKRAGVDNVQKHVLTSETDPFVKRHKDSADRVLVDAPCSGTGTWRRNPDLKWRFTQQDLDELQAIQARILESAHRLVKPGGRLIYVTCSILQEENEFQVKQFLTKHPEFRVVKPGEIWDKSGALKQAFPSSFLRMTPKQHGTDGFFAAVLEKNSRTEVLSNEKNSQEG